MLFCPNCAAMAKTISHLLKHIRRVHASDPSTIFQCNLEGCKRTFRKFKTLANHTYTFHSLRVSSDSIQENSLEDNVMETENDADLQNCDDQLSDPVIPECTLKRAAAMSILQIREEHHVPLSVMTSVQAINQGLFTFALEQIQNNGDTHRIECCRDIQRCYRLSS